MPVYDADRRQRLLYGRHVKKYDVFQGSNSNLITLALPYTPSLCVRSVKRLWLELSMCLPPLEMRIGWQSKANSFRKVYRLNQPGGYVGLCKGGSVLGKQNSENQSAPDGVKQ